MLAGDLLVLVLGGVLTGAEEKVDVLGDTERVAGVEVGAELLVFEYNLLAAQLAPERK